MWLLAGVGKVIEGWDIGLDGIALEMFFIPTEMYLHLKLLVIILYPDTCARFLGMRVGEKRRLIIPPSMGYVIRIL
jgi:hypothetical protein